MEKSFFFNSLNGDRKYLAEDFADYFGTILSNGLFLHEVEALKVMPFSGRTVRISSGKGLIQGYAYVNTDNVDKTLDVVVTNRIDRIVLQLNKSARKITLVVKKGTEATEPIAPELIRTADIWELGLADISLKSGTTAIIENMITDLRNNGNYCGGVTITVDRIDITEDISNAITTFTEATTRTNILTTEKASTIFGKIRKWFSDLKKLAFKDTVTTADIDDGAVTGNKVAVGAITDTKIAANADIKQSKINGLADSLNDKANTSGDYPNIKVGGIIANQVWSGKLNAFETFLNIPLIANYRYAVIFNDGNIAEGIAVDLGGGEVELTVTYANGCYATDNTASIQILTLKCSDKARTYYNGAYKINFEGGIKINNGIVTANGYADIGTKLLIVSKLVKLEKIF